MSDFNLNNVIEELHPCCLKEIESNKRNQIIKSELRRYDRSNVRLDQFKQVFEWKKSGVITCENCKSFHNYDILQRLRSQQLTSFKTINQFDVSDSDSGLSIDFELEDSIHFQSARLNEMQEIEYNVQKI